MKLKDLIVGILVGLIIGFTLFSVIKAFALEEERDVTKGPYMGTRTLEKHIYLYVYNDKKEVWDRARVEDLINAQCSTLRFYFLEEEEHNDTKKTISEKADGK